MTELKTAFEKSHNSVLGSDEVHYSFLKQIHRKYQELLLKTYNIWNGKQFPKSWKQATIIPIPKPGKNTSYPENYRPIALTSCHCKTLKRIVDLHLVWYLETYNLISNKQCGYKKKKKRGCTEHLKTLESYIREGFIKKHKKKHIITIFFNLEKAYDSTWKFGIIKDLYDLKLRGRLPKLRIF